MNTKHTKKALDNYRKILVEELKRELKKPNSKLNDSISGRKTTGKDGFKISMNDYGLNVNQGRSAGRFSNGGSKLPESFVNWVSRQPRYKNAKTGKMYTIKQSAFLIWKSISERGIRPTRFIDIVIDKVEPKMTLDIANAYLRDLNEALDKATPQGSNK